jgi:hypothetical protein
VKVSVAGRVFEAPSWRGAVGDVLAAYGKRNTDINQRLRAVDALMHGREAISAGLIIKPIREK